MIALYDLQETVEELIKKYGADIELIHSSDWKEFVKNEFNEDIECNIPPEYQTFIDYEKYENYFFTNRHYGKIEIGSDIFYFRTE